MKTFISYSHKDKAALGRLHTHLAVLRGEGLIVDWVDRGIPAGGVIDAEISERLESFELFLLLVSPDFLASDYCVEREMKRILERHRLNEARVVPIIIHPCDWASTPLQRLKALPCDGKPISEWSNEDTAYLDVVKELRRLLEAEEVRPMTEQEPVMNRSKSSRYRVKRDFDEIDRGDFREAAFTVIRDYFQGAAAEIDSIENLRGRFSSPSPNSFTCTVVNRARERGIAHITVHRRGSNMDLGDISYSFTENGPSNTANGMFTIKADEYELFLEPLMMGYTQHEERLTPEVAAEHLWDEFLEKAGVTSE